MKNLLLLLIMLGFAFISCKEDESVRPFVDINATLTNVPDTAAGVWDIPIPPSDIFKVPKAYKVHGNCDQMEGIDPEHSFFNTSDMVYDPLINGCRGTATITLSAPDGDELYMEGEFLIFQTYYNEAFFHFTGGTGKFDASDGWMKSTGLRDVQTGNTILTAAGKINEPKRN